MSRKSKPAGERHSIQHIAAEFGVDRSALGRKLAEVGTDISGGVTFREAFDAWTRKSDQDADRARRMKAEAESAEIDAAVKKRQLVLASECATAFREIATETRKAIEGEAQIPDAAKTRVLKRISEIDVKL
jgi:hypothetical protein